MDTKMYDATWGKRTSFSRMSLPKVTMRNFYLSSAFSGLYDKPSPFPYFECEPLIRNYSPLKFIKKWFMIFRHIWRFHVQFSWNSKKPLFAELTQYFPDVDPYTISSRWSLTPFYREYKGKKFNGNFYKSSEQLYNIGQVVPKEAFGYICEIGGGFGAMAEMIIKRHSPRLYCIIDIPETLQLSSMYLSTVFPGQVHHYESGTALPAVEGTLILLMQSDMANSLKEVVPTVGLFVNSNSFAEMHPDVVRGYFRLIEQYPGTYLSNTNPPRWEGEYLYAGPETYPYCDRWEFVLKKRQQLYYWRKNYQMISHLRA